MSNQTETENGVPEGMPTFENCPDWGKGGQFIYDPITQTRTRVMPALEQVTEPDVAGLTPTVIEEPSAAQAEAAPTTAQKKDKNRA